MGLRYDSQKLFRIMERARAARLALQDASQRRQDAMNDERRARNAIEQHWHGRGVQTPAALAKLLTLPLLEVAQHDRDDINAIGANKDLLIQHARARDERRRLEVIVDDLQRCSDNAGGCIDTLCDYVVGHGGHDPRKEI